jgi:hypothetical protein
MELASTLAKNATKPKPFNYHTTTDHMEGEQLEDHRNVGGNSCNYGDGTDQRVQSLMFMMMMMMICSFLVVVIKHLNWHNCVSLHFSYHILFTHTTGMTYCKLSLKHFSF